MRILYHPKRILGFEPYVAPEGFDRKAQPVDIYDVFERYYKNHRTAKYIYSVLDTATTCNLRHGTSYRYGYELAGVSYVVDPFVTLVRYTFSGAVTSVPVNDTTGFPSSGVISVNGSVFTYTSITSNTFVGSSQNIGNHNLGESVCSQFTWSGIKRWVIVNHTTTSAMTANVQSDTNAEWVYGGKLINCVNGSTGSGGGTLKWIHIDKLSNITSYSRNGHYVNPNLTGTLYISPSVTTITAQAFERCTAITGLVINEGVTSIGGNAFKGCTGITGELKIPNSVLTIGYNDTGPYNGNGAFISCTGLTSLVLGNSLTFIGTCSFFGCSNLNGNLILPDTMVTLGQLVFYGCSKLDSLDLGNGLQTIGHGSFQGCSQLVGTLTLPDSLVTIGTLAFYGCTSFSGTLTIPLNVTSIGQGAFGDDNFTDIDVTANSRYEDVDDVLYEISTRTALHSVKGNTGTITFQSNTLIIGDYCCLRNQRTGTLTVPDSVTRVGIYAFYDCDGFTALDLETTTSALATIDDYAFAYQSNLAGTITIPNSVTLIDANAFRDCLKVTGLSFGTGLITIGANAFYNLPLVTSLTLPSNLVTIGSSAFSAMVGLTGNIVIPNSVETIGASAFNGDTAITGTLTIGTGTKTIGGQAFGNVPFTGTLAIPSLVTAIGEGAFWNNNFSAISSAASGFTVYDYILYDETASGQIKAHTSARGYSGTLTFKAGTTSILYLCLYNNDNRTGAIVIPYTVTLIRQQAFDDCSGFNGAATIGDTTNGSALTSIEAYAFRGCANITGWNIYRTPAPTCNNSFSNYAKPLHIKSGATGYDVTPATAAAPWTNTAIFSSVTADL